MSESLIHATNIKDLAKLKAEAISVKNVADSNSYFDK